jgi:ATP adenylyltransferase/5',5'''-P-1,P-4-tetraphosphate phosphorylase II
MNNWKPHIIIPASPGQPLVRQVKELLEQQRATWDLFRRGEASLLEITSKKYSFDNREVIVQANPGRSISTNAKVDPKSVAERPCFLCPGSLPPPERGVAYGNYVILPNPYPILRHHMTITFRDHEPQRISGRINDLLSLTKELGPDMFVLYNGPRCGASAPDHMHFQACSSANIPLFEQLPYFSGDNQTIPCSSLERNYLSCSFNDTAEAEKNIQSALTALRSITGEPREPMVNIIALYSENRYIVNIFPRAKHRSACYFADPPKRLSISPAAVEMAGIIVVADATHFDRVHKDTVLGIYREVTLEKDQFSRLVELVI